MLRPLEIEALADSLTEWRQLARRRYALGFRDSVRQMQRHAHLLGAW